ncbi:DUF4249 domain-containing protein [Marinoscillum furvescens]|uniref:Uncharacterized protein DUF4249 n=1 Tax=Marinoscillum furvescens DSM 4134 TaxID=1122208 RepID=A0A3D9L3B3_MARFU|nr:DUF4249 domain-containing protein [Marinoscillum furvescens]RED98882.1 uncharacterized protein DUF4249 [Marinoscillum furvescens DSM 4134]
MKKVLYIILIAAVTYACEDTVEIDLEEQEPFMNVDAWLTHTNDTQQIRLTYTRPYFDNGKPQPALNATVSVVEIETQTLYSFTDADSDGFYTWIPAETDTFGTIGSSYALVIEHQGVTYESFSTMNPVPPIDSITFEYNKKDAFFEDDWYYADFWARDIEGPGNTYWIKAFKNGVYLNKPEEINVAYDASFSPGGEVDGLVFIQPIRTAINRFEDDDTPAPSPYQQGDTLKVELHSITEEAWFFLSRVRDETVRNPGFAQLFANPLANSPTNLVASGDNRVTGFFSVAAVSALEVEMNDDNIVDRIPE